MTRKTLHRSVIALTLAGIFASCQKSSVAETNNNLITADEKALVAAAGFNSNWFEKTSSGDYLIEGDILLSKAQLKEMEGKTPSHNFIVANEEHYRTYNIVATPTGTRTITVQMTAGFPSHYSTALDKAIARYNS